MFAEFERPQGNIFREPVNSFIGAVFLGTCALWAALFMWNVSTGSNPLDRAILAAIESQMTLK